MSNQAQAPALGGTTTVAPQSERTAGTVRGENAYTVTGPHTSVGVPLRMGIAALDKIRRDGGTIGPVLICHVHHVAHILTLTGSEDVWDSVPAAIAMIGTTDCGRHRNGSRYWIIPPGADEHRVAAETLRSALTDPRLKEEHSEIPSFTCEPRLNGSVGAAR